MNNMYVTTYRVMGQNFTIETTERDRDKAKAKLDKMIVGGYVFVSHLPMKTTSQKLSELLVNKHSKYHLKATKKDLALIALKLFMESRALLTCELEEAVEGLRDYIKTHKIK